MTYILENRPPKAREILLACERGKLFLYPCVYTQNAQIFMENSNMDEKQKKFDPLTRPPSQPLAAGPSICYLSLVTRGWGGGWGADRYALLCT